MVSAIMWRLHELMEGGPDQILVEEPKIASNTFDMVLKMDLSWIFVLPSLSSCSVLHYQLTSLSALTKTGRGRCKLTTKTKEKTWPLAQVLLKTSAFMAFPYGERESKREREITPKAHLCTNDASSPRPLFFLSLSFFNFTLSSS